MPKSIIPTPKQHIIFTARAYTKMLATKQFVQIPAIHLIWVWNFILHCFFDFSKSQSYPVVDTLVGKTSRDSSQGEGRKDCSVCSVKIDEQKDEIKELSCGHNFHEVCFARHVAEMNCPLCRGNFRQPLMVEEVQPLLEFCSLESSHRGSDAWWIR